MRFLNLGILAHVDAGKTTLTERLLYAAGVIEAPGRVDDGSTQTDSLALEQKRGITIKSAVVSFAIDDLTVNLIDTPGHPDFIAEVERVLSVLDGAVLVISAVEGVQVQTRLLMRALRRLRIPTLIFVNKIDRRGAGGERVLAHISEKLTPAIIPMGSTRDLGTRGAAFAPFASSDNDFRNKLAGVLTDHDDALLADYVDDENDLSFDRLRGELAAQTRRLEIHPVFFGSAITGTGVDSLTSGIADLLPSAKRMDEGPLSGTVFKIERGPAGEKIAYARMFSGTLRIRDRLEGNGDNEQKVTAISVFAPGSVAPDGSVGAGQIAKLWGLGDIKIGDPIGEPEGGSRGHDFGPPTLETVIVARRSEQKSDLYAALTELAEQDPMIDLRRDGIRKEVSVSLYGEVQKEVIQETLETDYGIEVDFRETTTICIERPRRAGAAIEVVGKEGNPFPATVGFRIEPGQDKSGVRYVLEVELGSLPLSFHRAIEEAVRETLQQGLYGWRVTDCTITLTHCGYTPTTAAGDFRSLSPLVLMTALKTAGTTVCEPIHRFRLDIPADSLGRVLTIVARLQGVPEAPVTRGATCIVEGEIPAARVHELQQRLPAPTRGEGVLESVFHSYQPVRGPVPSRSRTDHNPLNREEYLLHIVRRV